MKHPTTSSTPASNLPDALLRLVEARHHDPFEVLGIHDDGNDVLVRALLPTAEQVLIDGQHRMQRIPRTDLFEWRGPKDRVRMPYRLSWFDAQGEEHSHYDPYCFAAQVSDFDLHLFGEGSHRHAYQFLGANVRIVDAVPGVLFATWAPNADRVSIVGDFNAWDGRRHPMRSRGTSGVWELFIPELTTDTIYKFELRANTGGDVFLKSDPYAKACEQRPKTASIVSADETFTWQDQPWLEARSGDRWLHEAVSIYEVHLGSWRRSGDDFLNYRELAEQLVPYVKWLGFTHIELLPITEHPFDDSWGYQTTGYFAPTSRFGTPDDFRYFVDLCHRNNIGVLLDWVPAHFPKDAFSLARFDGTALYEHDDPRKGEHRDWGTLIFNYARAEVKSFLISSAIYWLKELHLDGLRVDAVASMLYLDYSRDDGEWIPNEYGGNENLAAMDFLRELNEATHGECPGSITIAEESTAWPQVTRPTYVGGLGFSMKWNMGWMHDTLVYMSKDPVHRAYHHDQLTFGLLYAFTENFVLPFSHDEVVHGKGSMLNKMPGDDWQKFANLRLLYTYLWTYPGKKLLFMGCEFAQRAEWSNESVLDWPPPEWESHCGIQILVRDLNTLYAEHPALHEADFESSGFAWLDCHDAKNSVISYSRTNGTEHLIVVLNFTPVPHHDYRIGVRVPGTYREVLNSDSCAYGGSDIGNGGAVTADTHDTVEQPFSLCVTLPPLAALVFVPTNDAT